MRIISGNAGRRRLSSFKGRDIRPTSDKVRGAIFNIIGSSIEGAAFLDLYAGTGSIGIEAKSRGAGVVVMIDKSFAAKEVIYKNLDRCGFTKYIDKDIFFYKTPVLTSLDILYKKGRRFDIIFIDPPYKMTDVYSEILIKLSGYNLLNTGGIVILEHYFKNRLDEHYGTFSLIKEKRFGDTAISIYRNFNKDKK